MTLQTKFDMQIAGSLLMNIDVFEFLRTTYTNILIPGCHF